MTSIKQILYIVAVVVLIIISQRIMTKIKDLPDDDGSILPENYEEEQFNETEENPKEKDIEK
ncbi:MAG: hypothetical protein LBB64_01765 [Dysgonamonadaceae bacterium]|nr:hypothetical protein [Dysgonamonadaceae bacterium]